MRQILDHVYLNNKTIHREKAKIPLFDNGFLYGHAIFTTLKISKKHPLFLNYHLKRLQSNSKSLSIPFPTNLKQAILETIAKNNLTNGGLRITISPSILAIHTFTAPNHSRPYICHSHPLPCHSRTPSCHSCEGGNPELSSKNPVEKISVITVPDTRDIYKTIKTTYRIPHLLAKKKAASENAQDAIFTKNNQLIESTTANIFTLSNNGTIITPPIKNKGLNGITRQILMKHLPIQEEPILASSTNPLILVNSLKIRTVIKINNQKLKQNPNFSNLILTTLQNAEESEIRRAS